MARAAGYRGSTQVRDNVSQKKQGKRDAGVMTVKRYVWKNAAGWCGLGWTGDGLVRFRFGLRVRKDVAAFMPDGAKPFGRNDKAPPWVAKTVKQLDCYFAGRRVEFEAPLDWSAATLFQREVWAAAREIPYGETRSYGGLARAIGRPGAARAVGNALGENPAPVIVPCHRIVRVDGTTGGFTAGPGLKEALLSLERGGDFKIARGELLL